jgi:hypothetical protein
LIATITVYESDFHILKIIPNRFTRDRTYGSGYRLFLGGNGTKGSWVGMTNTFPRFCCQARRDDSVDGDAELARAATTPMWA